MGQREDSEDVKAIIQQVTNAATSAAAGAAGAAATGAPTNAVLAAAALWALFPPSVGLALWVGFESRRLRASIWWDQLVRHMGDDTTPQELAGTIQSHAEEPWVRETILESVRKLLEAVDETVVPALASLNAEYLKEKNPPDAFFRGFARFLAELAREEYESCRSMVIRAYDARPSEQQYVELHYTESTTPQVMELHLVRSLPDRGRSPLGTMSHLPRLFYLLKHHGLGRDNPAGFYDTISGPQVIIIPFDQISRIRDHVV